MPSPTSWPVRGNIHTGDRYVLTEKFVKRPCINADLASGTEATREPANDSWELLGTNAVSADVGFSAGGGITLATHGAATDSSIILPHLDTLQTAFTGTTFTPAQSPIMVATVRTNTALTNTTIWVGLKLTNTPVVATDDDQILFRYQNGTDTTWQATYSIAGTDTTTNTSVSVAASTTYTFWIVVDSARIAYMWINGVLVVTSTALTSAAALIPYIGILSATDASAKTLIVRQVELSVAIAA